jgi:hypothetical protein
MPAVVIVATWGAEETQVTMLVTSIVLPPAKVSVALNCCELRREIVGLCGLIENFTTSVEAGVLLFPQPANMNNMSP